MLKRLKKNATKYSKRPLPTARGPMSRALTNASPNLDGPNCTIKKPRVHQTVDGSRWLTLPVASRRFHYHNQKHLPCGFHTNLILPHQNLIQTIFTES